MSAPSDRRGFLRGLVSLPLIGGGVTLIGAPTAVAAPVTSDMLDSYDAWLFYKRRYLQFERYGRPEGDRACHGRFAIVDTQTGQRFDYVSIDNAGGHFHGSANPLVAPQASSRAALVLSTVGCDWREGGL